MRVRWTRGHAAAIAAGGVVGAATRWALLTTVEAGGDFPWPVLLANLVGSLVLGMALAEEWARPGARTLLHDAVGIGFCGGLTTFSTFALEAATLFDGGATGSSLAYAGASLFGSPAAVFAGAAALRRARAVTLPLEEAP